MIFSKKFKIHSALLVRIQTVFKYFAKERYLIAFIVIFAIVTHSNWFNPYSSFSYADFRYVFDSLAKDYPQAFATWLAHKSWGANNVQAYFYPIYAVIGFMVDNGVSAMNAIKTTYFIPTAIISAIAPYLLVRRLTGSKTAALLASLVYAYNTHFIWRQQQHYTIAFAFAIAPLVIWAYITAISKYAKYFSIRWVVFLLVYAVSLMYEPRITFITTIVMAIYATLYVLVGKFSNFKQLIIPHVVFFAILIALNLYWLLPALIGGGTENMGNLAGRETIADSQYDILRALALSDHSWTGGALRTGFPQPVMAYLWLIPLAALALTIAFKSKTKKDRVVKLTFLLVLCIGVLLTKQNSEPFAGGYDFIRTLPGFSVFRTASPFYLLTALAYCGLIGIGIKNMLQSRMPRQTKSLFVVAVAIIIPFVTVLNVTPTMNGEIKGTLVNYQIPDDYLLLKKKIDSEPDYFKVLWTPIKSRWGATDIRHPAIDMREVYNIDASSPVSSLIGDARPFEGVKQFFDKEYSPYLLNSWGVKYVVLPQSDANVDFPANYDKFLTTQDTLADIITKQSYLQEVDFGLSEIRVFENKNYSPRVGANVDLYRLQNMSDAKTAMGYLDTLERQYELTTDHVEGGKIERAFIDNKSTAEISSDRTLIVDNNIGSLAYEFKDNTIQLVFTKGAKLDGIIDQNTQQEDKVLHSFTISENSSYSLEYNGRYHQLINDGVVRDIGTINTKHNNHFKLLKSDTTRNMITADSIHSAWSGQIMNCGGVGGSVRGSNTVYQGTPVLEIESKSGVACAKLSLNAHNVNNLLVTIPTASPSGERSGFAMIPTAKKDEAIYRQIYSEKTDKPTNYNEILSFNNYTGPIDLYLYDFKESGLDAPTYYGLPEVTSVSLVEEFDLAAQTPSYTSYTSQNVVNDSIKLDASIAMSDFKPLFPNGSFENGAWSKAVKDCAAYDSRADIAQEISTDRSTEGNNSLKLYAKRHRACTTQSYRVPRGSYRLSLDYMSETAGAGVFISTTSGDVSETQAKNLSATNGQWSRYDHVLTFNHDTLMTVGISVDEPKKTSLSNTAYFDNVQLEKVNDYEDKYLLLTPPPNIQSTSASIISYEPERIDGKFATCRVSNIVSSNRFDKRWLLDIADSTVTYNQYATVSGMNIWQLSGGTQDCAERRFTLDYKPRGLMRTGLGISSAVLLLLLIVTLYLVAFQRFRVAKLTKMGARRKTETR